MPQTFIVASDAPEGVTGFVTPVDYLGPIGSAMPNGTILGLRGLDQGYLSEAYTVELVARARGHIILGHTATATSAGAVQVPPTRRLLPADGPLHIGVLYSAGQPFGASTQSSVDDALAAFIRLGFSAEQITRSSLERLDRVDGLFIRDLTSPVSYTMNAARYLEQRGGLSLDSTASIALCSNKIAIGELLNINQVSQPRWVTVCPNTTALEIVQRLGLPCVVKIPHGSFSRGVRLYRTLLDLGRGLDDLRTESAFLVAQEYIKSDFDWRIGVLGAQPLFGCKYGMVPGHWQIIKHLEGMNYLEGDVDPLPIAEIPTAVLALAIRAASAVGDGLYGVDIKSTPSGPVVIEVNANPDIYSDCEAFHDSDQVWSKIAEWFAVRLRENNTVTISTAA